MCRGGLTLISRMGADKIRTHLPPLLLAIKESDHPIAWVCDPMHGNTYTAPSGHKTRHFDTVLSEIEGFFAAHLECGTWPGGVHLELTGDHVTECLGGSDDITDDELIYAFETLCDPAPQCTTISRLGVSCSGDVGGCQMINRLACGSVMLALTNRALLLVLL